MADARANYVTMTLNEYTKSDDLVLMAREVFGHLQDEISKKIFEARCLYAMTGDVGKLTGLNPKYRNLNSDIETYAENIQKGEHVLIHGNGMGALYLAKRLPVFGVKIDAFIDPDDAKAGVEPRTGIKVISEREMAENRTLYSTKKVIIANSRKHVADEVQRRLLENVGIREENIARGVYDFRNCTPQYFDYFEPGENEVFVDCGCFDGGTCFRFAGWCGQKGYEHIYSFEADPKNCERCKELLKPLGKCDLYPYGTAGENGEVCFVSRGFEDSCIISREEAEKINFEGVTTIETVKLDDVLKGKRITFIKMDIEGAEFEALQGAEELIRENRPRMAISVYHKPEDFITIPCLILQMNPEYRLSFRHYGLDELETILYVE